MLLSKSAVEFSDLRSRLGPLSSFQRPWFVAGGWAIDLFLGCETRIHQDVDIAVFRQDQLELRRHFSRWKWEKVINGTVMDWAPDEWSELPVHELHANSGEHRLEFLLNERREDHWEYRRDRTVVRSISQFQTRFGFPTLPPELVLLFRSENPSPRDLTDFRKAWPQLNAEARQWLSEAMVKVRPITWNTVEITDYDEQWPAAFDRIAAELKQVLGELVYGIEHVGSTSVPGLAAKPIVDIDLLISSQAEFPKVRERLERFGYIHRGPRGVEGREVFRCVIDLPKHLLYVCEPASQPVVEQLAFRDYLRNHPELAAAYANLKKDLARRFATDRERYTESKTDFIRGVLESATTARP